MEDSFIFERRILDRAEKQKVFDGEGLRFSELAREYKSVILSKTEDNIKPLITYWSSVDKWTVLTWNRLYSYHNDSMVSCSLDEIEGDIEGVTPDGGRHRRETLKTTEILFLRRPKIYVWVPPGDDLHAFWNVLMYCRPRSS